LLVNAGVADSTALGDFQGPFLLKIEITPIRPFHLPDQTGNVRSPEAVRAVDYKTILLLFASPTATRIALVGIAEPHDFVCRPTLPEPIRRAMLALVG
jgi:hypothetical protein